MRNAIRIGFCLFLILWTAQGFADEKKDYQLGSGDSIKIVVYRNPDLEIETRVTESGTIRFPLLGTVHIGGLTVSKAEDLLAKGLKDGGFVQQAQVNITVVTIRANLVSILGQVNRPGLYPLDAFNIRLTEMLALAGGASSTGGDKVILIGTRQGNEFKKELDIGALFLDNRTDEDPFVSAGDKIYVPLAPVYYIFGEVQKPGSYRVERGMSVMQALAEGGGLTTRGTLRSLRLHRRNAKGELEKLSPEMSDLVQPNDVIYVNESIF